jgi:tRNA (adenine58-N1)-methyltransferase non-catalytic subunit
MLIEKGHYFIIKDLSGFETIQRAAPKIFNMNKCAIDLNDVIG